ncbi:MAG: ATP-binding cassette domain-containing protein [Cloacibacillus evryensis]
MTPLLEARGLSYAVGGRAVLSDISFSVGRGCFLAVIGPNGAGKSTMLKCLGGLTAARRARRRSRARHKPDDGAREGAPHRLAPSERRRLLPFTVRQFAMMSRYPWRPVLSGESAEDRRIVDDALARAGVRSWRNAASHALGGERPAPLLAAALARSADILFLDEPTSFLDYRQRGGDDGARRGASTGTA